MIAAKLWLQTRTLAILLAWSAVRLLATEPPVADRPADAPRSTAASKREYFWADELVFHDWRIQRNAVLRTCRLVDGAGKTQGTGSFEQCRIRLEEIKHERNLGPMKGKVVLILHGLAGHRAACGPLAQDLQEHGGYAAFTLTYPSLFEEVAGPAQSLDSVVRNLYGVEEINFVAHSLGNLVVRHYLGDQTDKPSGRRPDPRIKRIVMIGPPNHGSAIARSVDAEWHENKYVGKTVEQLGHRWSQLAPKLATPECEFGIIAGGTGKRFGFNQLLSGDNDGVVEVSSARLAGAHDFVLVPALHFRMHQSPKVHEYVLRFLRDGCFVSPGRRQPIPQGDSRP